MTEKDPTSRPQLRAVQYYYVDGTFEFSFGGLCLLLAIYFFIEGTLPESLLSNLLNMAFVLIVVGGAFLVNRLVQRLKERITYPRTGYVAYKQVEGSKRIARIFLVVFSAAFTGAFMAVFFSDRPDSLNWMPGMSGLFFAAVMAWLGFRVALPRFYLLAAVLFLIGGGLTVSGIRDMLGLAIFYALTSLVLFLSGGLTLWQYLRQTRSPEEEAPK
jgi:hypothetical protein